MEAYKGYLSTKPSILIQPPCHFRYFAEGREPPVLKSNPARTNMTRETDRPGMCINFIKVFTTKRNRLLGHSMGIVGHNFAYFAC